MLESVINISEGKDKSLIQELKQSCSSSLLDVHIDALHNRSVFTLAGDNVVFDVKALVSKAVKNIDLSRHKGIHPRFGAVDVVPFIVLPGLADTILEEAVEARDSLIRWFCDELKVPAVSYGPERSLPDLRKLLIEKKSKLYDEDLFSLKTGVTAVGARKALVAYNITVKNLSLQEGKIIADSLRSNELRILAFGYEDKIQISCNLIAPWVLNPDHVYRAVDALAKDMDGKVHKAELVGLLPRGVLDAIDENIWGKLDLGITKTIEYRLSLNQN